MPASSWDYYVTVFNEEPSTITEDKMLRLFIAVIIQLLDSLCLFIHFPRLVHIGTLKSNMAPIGIE